MSTDGKRQIEIFMGLIDSMEGEMLAFRKLAEKAEVLEGVVAKRFERMTRGLGNLRTESLERLDETAFGDITEDIDDVYRDTRHDLRNRLNPVSLACQGLLRKLKDSEGVENLGQVQVLIESSLELIDGYGVEPTRIIVDLKSEPRVEPRRARADEAETDEEEHEYQGEILIADDSEDDREELAEALREVGHSITIAPGGGEAIELLNERDFDIVLLDLSMPGKDGFWVLDQLKQQGKLKYTPVIVVTGRRGEEDAVDCISLGAEGFLTKPVRSKLLMAEVDRSLEKRRLREREYEQFFPPAVARQFARRPDSPEMEAKQAEVTVLFCDIRGFSSISEKLGPERTVPWLNDVMETFSQCILDREGVLVDYTGDEVMAMWGAPRQTDDHGQRACEAAVDMLESLPILNERWEKEIGRATEVGIGLNSGPAFVGNVGTKRRLKYGPLGNTVNLASRVQGATSYGKTSLMITKQTRSGLSKKWLEQTRMLCDVRVKNIIEPVTLFEVAESDRPQWSKIKKNYETALEQFRSQQFPASMATLGNLLHDCPDDGPSLLLMSRVVEAMLNQSGGFDPVWELPGK